MAKSRRSFLRQARQHYLMHNYRDALQAIRQQRGRITRKDFYLIGSNYLGLQQKKKGIKYLMLYLLEYPHHQEALTKFVQTLIQMNNINRAKKWLKKIVKTNKKSWKAHFYLGQIYQKHRSLCQSLKNYKISKQLNPYNPDIQASIDRVQRELRPNQQEQQLQQQKLQNIIISLDKNKIRLAGQCRGCQNGKSQYANKQCGHLTACSKCVEGGLKACPVCQYPGKFFKVFSS